MLVEPKPFWLALESFGDDIALISECGHWVTYHDLAARADAFALQLGPERLLVAIEAHNSIEALCAYVGALRANHVVLMLPPDGYERNRELYRTYQPDARYCRVNGDWQLTLNYARHELHADLAMLLSTSGTAGAAKLVKLSKTAVASNAKSISSYLGIGHSDRAITSLPIHYSYGLSVVNSHLSAGATLLLTERSVVDAEFWEFFSCHAGTSFAGVPHTYHLLEQTRFFDQAHPALKVMTQAGGKMPVDTIERFAAWGQQRSVQLFIMYGQTEATARMAYLPPERLGDAPDCIGRAIPGGALYLLDEEGNFILNPNEPGQLAYRGENVMMGYALSPEDLADGPELELLLTGDLAERTICGLFRIVGRQSRFVKPFGLRVGLDDIEALLRDRGIIAMVAGADDLISIAYRGAHVPQAVVEHVTSRLALPRTLFDARRVEEFPLLPNGKFDYFAILNESKARVAQTNDGTTRQGLAPSLEALMGRPIDPAVDSFDTLDGDSLTYVNAAMEIDRHLGYIPDNWQAMTVAELDLLADSRQTISGRLFKSFDTETAIRSMAIVSVVLTHMGFGFFVGGSDALLILSGYSVAKFNSSTLLPRRFWKYIKSFLERVVLPYYLILSTYSLLYHKPSWPYFALISNLSGHREATLSVFWFVEALLHILLLIAIAISIKRVRKYASSDPLRFGYLLLSVSYAIRIASFQIFPERNLPTFSTESVFPVFLLGWITFFSRTLRDKIFVIAVAMAVALTNSGIFVGNDLFGVWDLEIGLMRGRWIMASLVILAFTRTVMIPWQLGKVTSFISEISLSIYLSHIFIIYKLKLHPVVVFIAIFMSAFIFHRSLAIVNLRLRELRSGLVDHSQKMRVAARAMAEKKAVGHRS